METNYLPLSVSSDADAGADDVYSPRENTQCARYFSTQRIIIVLLTLTNILTVTYISARYHPRLQAPPPVFVSEELAVVESLSEIYTAFHWWTPYGSHNHTRDNPHWDAINPSHGFIAIDRHEAKAKNWPSAMHLPSDDSKGVYLLEAYHQLHCLKAVRAGFWAAIQDSSRDTRSEMPHPSPHIEHCFDTLRQSILCHADNLPLYTFGDNTAGDGQMHQCRSWDALRDYATKNTACYRDTNHSIPLGEHFGYCDNGVDGIIWPNTGVDY